MDEGRLEALLKLKQAKEYEALKHLSEVNEVVLKRRDMVTALERALVQLDDRVKRLKSEDRDNSLKSGELVIASSITGFIKSLKKRRAMLTARLEKKRDDLRQAEDYRQRGIEELVDSRIGKKQVEQLLEKLGYRKKIHAAAREELRVEEIYSRNTHK